MMPGLNALLSDYENAGVVGLGFPSNQFYLQEPGRPGEIMNCYEYVRPGGGWTPHPSYHIFGKLDVNGKTADKLYKFLKSACPAVTEEFGNMDSLFWNDLNARDITWNYGKFLVDANGKPRYRFGPTVTLDQVYEFVDELLAE